MNHQIICRRAVVVGLLLCGAAPVAHATAAQQAIQDRPKDAGNTAVNANDRKPDAVTPTDQSNSDSAVRITANIRRAVVDDKSLSTSAHNVKIITQGNTVTLRGPVASAAEKERIDALARQFAPGMQVRNEISIKGT